MTSDITGPAALILWAVAFLATGSLFVVANARCLEAYRRRYGGFMSDDERMDAFGANPGRFLRLLPGDTLARLSAIDSRPDDPSLDRLRRRAVRLMVAAVAILLLGLPILLVAVALVARFLNAQ